MIPIIDKYNIKGPVNLLFLRSQSRNKKENNNKKMAASIPNIKIKRESERPVVKLSNAVNIDDIKVDNGEDSDDSGETIDLKENKDKKPEKQVREKNFKPEKYKNFLNSSKVKERKESLSDSSSEYSSTENSSEEDCSSSVSGESEESELNSKSKKTQKQEILLKLLALEKKGVELSKKFSMDSKLEDLKFELAMHSKNTEVEMSIKFQQKMLVAAVTGLEFVNKKFDPVGAKLDGWGESVMDNIDDFESTFIQLHEKYKGKSNLPPEVQLLVTLAGSAFMFHLTKTMFSSSMPRGLDSAQSEEIMKNISKAMAENKSEKEITGPSYNLSSIYNKNIRVDDEMSTTSTIETSKEVTVDQKGRKTLNL